MRMRMLCCDTHVVSPDLLPLVHGCRPCGFRDDASNQRTLHTQNKPIVSISAWWWWWLCTYLVLPYYSTVLWHARRALCWMCCACKWCTLQTPGRHRSIKHNKQTTNTNTGIGETEAQVCWNCKGCWNCYCNIIIVIDVLIYEDDFHNQWKCMSWDNV